MTVDDSSREQLVADLGFLTETAMGFLERDAGSDLYQYIVERLAGITGDSWVALSTFHPERQATCLRALTGPSGLRARVFQVLGENPIGQFRPISDEARRNLLTGQLHRVPGGLYDVLYQQVPRPVTQVLEQLAGIKEVFGMGCVAKGELLGAVLVLLRSTQRELRTQVVEAFVHQAAVALQRERAEDRLRTQEIRIRQLFDQLPDVFLVLKADLTIQEVNRHGVTELGYTRGALIGKALADVLVSPQIPILFTPEQAGSGDPVPVRCEFRRADGDTRLYEGRATPLSDGRWAVIVNPVSA